MPQMAPISWFILFIVFSLTFVLFNIMNYYIFLYSPFSQKLYFKKDSKSIIWKW